MNAHLTVIIKNIMLPSPYMQAASLLRLMGSTPLYNAGLLEFPAHWMCHTAHLLGRKQGFAMNLQQPMTISALQWLV